MTEDSKALLQEARTAIEALLEEFRANDLPYGSKAYAAGNEVSHKLRKALMLPPSKPIAWRWLYNGKPEINHMKGSTCWDDEGPDPDIEQLAAKAKHPRTVQYLWEGPPSKHEWQTLIDEELPGIAQKADVAHDDVTITPFLERFARVIEQRLKEKNHG